jgi:hypothetical protein
MLSALLSGCADWVLGPTSLPTITPFAFLTATPRPSPVPTRLTDTPVPSPTARIFFVAPTPSPASAEPTVTRTPTRTPIPTVTIAGIADQPCEVLPVAVFRTVWLSDPGLPSGLGCPTSPDEQAPRAWPVQIRYQTFERGHMLRLSNVGWFNSPVIYALLEDSTYTRHDDTYSPGFDPVQGGPTPPEGLYRPTEALGKVWREAPGLSEAIGFATGPPIDSPSEMQLFAYGEMLSIPAVGAVFVFKLGDPGSWSIYAVPPA